MAASAFNKIDLLKDAEEYVESVMSAQGASIVRTPAMTIGGRKRQLSMPDESVMKKAKGEASGDRDFHRARRTLYKRKDNSSDEEDDGEADQSKSLLSVRVNKNGKRNKAKTTLGKKTECDSSNMQQMEKEQISGADADAGAKGNSKKTRKPKKKQNQSDFELIMTEADVHVDGDDSDLDTRGLLHKMCSQMQHHFTALDRKIDRLGASLEKAITDKITKVIDKRINTETARLRKVIDDSVNDIRKEIESDMGDLTERVSEISARMESSQPSRVTNDENNGRKLNIVIRR